MAAKIPLIEPQLLGPIVERHRKAAGLSRIALAEMAGIGKTALYDVEKGKTTVRLDTLFRIFNVLNITVYLGSPFFEHAGDEDHAEG